VFSKDEIIGLEMGIASFSKGESQEVDQGSRVSVVLKNAPGSSERPEQVTIC
jgi:hypothetical protein